MILAASPPIVVTVSNDWDTKDITGLEDMHSISRMKHRWDAGGTPSGPLHIDLYDDESDLSDLTEYVGGVELGMVHQDEELVSPSYSERSGEPSMSHSFCNSDPDLSAEGLCL